MDGTAGMLKPRPLGVVVHGKEVGAVLHFDFLHIGTGRPVGEDGIGGEAVKYLLVVMEDVIGYTWLEPAAVCTAAVTLETLLR